MPLLPVPAPQSRLQFIDAARSIAILLMLEGHFVSLTLAPQWHLVDHPVYQLWSYVRGMTAPLFFTMAGLVFAYLLSGAKEPCFFSMRRVQRGFIRAGELLVWGYLLQLNFKHLGDVIAGRFDPWSGAFHVLQCIGVGLLGLLALFGLLRRWGLYGLMVGYGLMGLGIFMLWVFLLNHHGYFPVGAPPWMQNPLKGPLANFPIAPWLSYTFYGAVVGVILRIRQGVIPAWMVLTCGLIIRGCGRWIDYGLSKIIGSSDAVIPTGFHLRVGECLIVIGVVIWLEKRFHPLPDWFLAVGRNTFPIYIGHAIILNGAAFGIGLHLFLTEVFNPWQAALGALIFCGVCAWVVQGVEPLSAWWREKRRLWNWNE